LRYRLFGALVEKDGWFVAGKRDAFLLKHVAIAGKIFLENQSIQMKKIG
jgi:hypothetical protein